MTKWLLKIIYNLMIIYNSLLNFNFGVEIKYYKIILR